MKHAPLIYHDAGVTPPPLPLPLPLPLPPLPLSLSLSPPLSLPPSPPLPLLHTCPLYCIVLYCIVHKALWFCLVISSFPRAPAGRIVRPAVALQEPQVRKHALGSAVVLPPEPLLDQLQVDGHSDFLWSWSWWWVVVLFRGGVVSWWRRQGSKQGFRTRAAPCHTTPFRKVCCTYIHSIHNLPPKITYIHKNHVHTYQFTFVVGGKYTTQTWSTCQTVKSREKTQSTQRGRWYERSPIAPHHKPFRQQLPENWQAVCLTALRRSRPAPTLM